MTGLTGEWRKGDRLFGKMGKLMKKNVQLATKRNAMMYRDQIKRTIRSGQGMAPVSPLTKAYKKSSKPLIDHGDLLQAVDSITISPSTFFVGVPRTAGKKDGTSMVNIAAVHEFGATIRPVSASALTIPVTREASELAREHGGVGEIPGLFRPKGTKVLARKKGKGFEIMFILKDEVVIPPRPFIEPSLDRVRHKMKRQWERAIIAALRGKRYAARS